MSDYLLDTARQHIEGDISIDIIQKRIKAYYEMKSGHDAKDEEGDIASTNIVKIINEPSFAFFVHRSYFFFQKQKFKVQYQTIQSANFAL